MMSGIHGVRQERTEFKWLQPELSLRPAVYIVWF